MSRPQGLPDGVRERLGLDRLPDSTAALLVCLLLALAWSLGLRVGARWGAAHWFYIPILYAAARFGAPGAALAALASAFLAGPLLPQDAATAVPQEPLAWIVRIPLFVFVGEMAAFLLHAHHPRVERPEPADEETQRRSEQAALIRRLIEEDGMAVVFQPIVELSTGRVVGVESLARFPQEFEQPPDRWFADAWEVGLGVELEVAALRKAVDLGWRLPRGVFQAVNLSPEVLESGAFEELIQSLPWIRLVVELTEHIEVQDYARLARPVAEIRDRGGQVAIDDVGAGFASLRHVVSLAPDIVKLDDSLWRGVDLSQPRLTLSKGVVACSHELGAVVVAERIESREEAEALQEVGANYGQGYFLGRPAPLGPTLALYPPRPTGRKPYRPLRDDLADTGQPRSGAL
jgi:EAL domain-containing protein (putative c-di-GMP-specific phosphodiesterase class I)